MMRTFFAEFTVDPARSKEFDAVFEEYTAEFRRRGGAGCQFYEVMRHPTDPSRRFVYEQWADDETFNEQIESEPFKELRVKIKDLGITHLELYGFEADAPSTVFSGSPQELPSAEELFDEDEAG